MVARKAATWPSGEEGGGTGFNAYLLRASDAMDIAQGEVSKSNGHYKLVATQEHHLIDGSAPALKPGQVDTTAGRSHDILRSATLAAFASGKYPEPKAHHDPASLYPPMWPSDISTKNQTAERDRVGEHPDGSTGGEKLGKGNFDADGIDRSHSQDVERVVPQHYPKPINYAQHQWGMSVDLKSCIGCNACSDRLPGGKQHRDRRQRSG